LGTSDLDTISETLHGALKGNLEINKQEKFIKKTYLHILSMFLIFDLAVQKNCFMK
jgi:hypothetical protein